MTESARIASLETQVRTLKRMLFGVFGLVVAGAVLGATSLQTVPDVIQAKKFEVVNDEGKVLVQLGSLKTNDYELGFITTRNRDGRSLVNVAATEDGNGSVTVKNGKGGLLVGVGSCPSGGIIETQNGNGGRLVSISCNPSGGFVTTENGKGGKFVSLGIAKGSGAITVDNGKRENFVLLGAFNGRGYVATSNAKGEALVELTANLGGKGVVITSDGNGARTSQTP